MKIKIVKRSRHKLTEYITERSAGMDLRANIDIKDWERIRQMIISKHERAEWIAVDELLKTERGAGGLGHTGEH
jgi:dUTPase